VKIIKSLKEKIFVLSSLKESNQLAVFFQIIDHYYHFCLFIFSSFYILKKFSFGMFLKKQLRTLKKNSSSNPEKTFFLQNYKGFWRGVDTELRFCSSQLWNVRIFRVFSWNVWIVGVFYEFCALLTKFYEVREFLAKCTDFQKNFFVYSGQNAIILAALASQVYIGETSK
jgi:hypothetical protein